MANTIKLKNSAVAAKTPLLTDLAYGEVALNYADGKIYYKRSDNTIQSISGGGGGVTSVTGTTPVVSSGGTTPAISMPAATTSVSGYLTSANWTTFNAKAPLANPVFTTKITVNGLKVGGSPEGGSPTDGDYNTIMGVAVLSNALGGASANNSAFGYWALTNNTFGNGNCAFGSNTLSSNTWGADNVAVGNSSLTANTMGDANVGIGSYVLYSNTTGIENVGVGRSALGSNTTGSDNVAIGYSASGSQDTASNTVSIGAYSLSSITTSSNNTAVGFQSGFNTTGASNTLIGYNAGQNLTTGSNNTFIGSYAGTAGLANTIVLSAGTTEKLRITTAGGLSLGATGTAVGTAGQVLQSNGDATPTWVTPSGGGSTWTKITTATTATTGQQLLATSTVVTLTLPATPVAGNSVMVMDAGSWSATNLTIARNGSTIEGLAEDLVCNVSGTIVTLVYDGTTWQVVANVGAQGPQGPAGSGTAVLTDTVASWAVVSTIAATNPTEIFFKPDGLKMFLLTATTLNQYTLSTAWDITTAGAGTAFTTTWDTASNGLFISPDGTKLITCGTVAVVNAGLGILANEDRVYYLTLATPWDITTATLVSSVRLTTIGDANPLATGGIPAAMTSLQAVHFNSTGTIMYIQDATTDYVNQFSLSTAYNVSTAQWVKRFSVAAVESGGTGLRFNAAGTRMYLTGSTNDIIAEYRLSTAWDIATAVYYDNLYVELLDGTPNGLYIDETSKNAYMVGSSSDLVARFTTNLDGILIAPVLAAARIDLVGETRIKNASLIVDNSIVSADFYTAQISASGSSTFSSSFTLSNTTSTISLGESQTTGVIRIGGTTGTGIITLGQSTAAQVLSIANGATLTGVTKTVNIGASGVSGSTTNINIGSAVSGATSTTTVKGTVTVAGQIESTVTGFKFPDGTVQASAASGGGVSTGKAIAMAMIFGG